MAHTFDPCSSGTDRRDFLKIAGASAAALGLGGLAPALAQEPASGAAGSRSSGGGKPALVAVYLRGGMDAIGALVPYRDTTYYAIRPTIAIPAESVITLDDTFGLHPSLAPLKPWWDAKRLAPIINVGSHHGTRTRRRSRTPLRRGEACSVEASIRGERSLLATRPAVDSPSP